MIVVFPDTHLLFLETTLSHMCKAVLLDVYLQVSCLFVCFVALRPKSTGMVMAGRSVYLITLFPGQA